MARKDWQDIQEVVCQKRIGGLLCKHLSDLGIILLVRRQEFGQGCLWVGGNMRNEVGMFDRQLRKCRIGDCSHGGQRAARDD